jgi:protein ImuB
MGGTKMTKLPELYACIYVKEFPAQALLRLRSDLQSQPCVVMEGEPPLQTVCSLNVRARVLGATRGMTRVEIETLPAMTVLQRSHNEEVSAAAALLETAGTFSPRIEDHSYDAAFICVLDIAGTEQLLGTPDRLGRNLFKRIRSIGITASIAMTANVHASISLARSMSLRAPVMMVPRGDEGKALAPLPVSMLELSPDEAETFASWGIHTLDMLTALPEKELIARMGQAGKRLRQLALGTLPHFFQLVEPPLTLEERMELESPIELLEPLLFVMNTMLGQLILRASSRVLALASVTITLTALRAADHIRERFVRLSQATMVSFGLNFCISILNRIHLKRQYSD